MIVKTVGPTQTKYTDVSEDARGAGMEKVGEVNQNGEFWSTTVYYAGGEITKGFDSRLQAERFVENEQEEPSLIFAITVS